MSFIRSILGDLPAEKMGITFSHEHVVIEENYVTLNQPEFLLNDLEKICIELVGLKKLGCALDGIITAKPIRHNVIIAVAKASFAKRLPGCFSSMAWSRISFMLWLFLCTILL